MRETAMTKKRSWRIAGTGMALVLAILCFLLIHRGRTAAGEAAIMSPDVEVAAVEQKDVPVYREWIGTLDGMVNASDPFFVRANADVVDDRIVADIVFEGF
jgi:hypothetical protein